MSQQLSFGDRLPTTRREYLTSWATAGVVAIAGCTGGGQKNPTTQPPKITGSPAETTEPPSETPTSTQTATPTPATTASGAFGHVGYSGWLGPEMADVQKLHFGEKPDYVSGFESTSPSRAAELSILQDSVKQSLEDNRVWVPRARLESAVDPQDVDRVTLGVLRTFGIMTGEFNRDAIEATLEEWADRRDPYRGQSVFVAQGVNRKGEQIGEGYVVGNQLVVRIQAPTKKEAVEFAHKILDTGADAAPRFTETHETTRTVINLLGDGVFVIGSSFGTPQATGLRIRIEGETAYRRSVTAVESDFEKNVEYIREQVNKAKNTTRDDDIRTALELFVPYDSVSVKTKDDIIIVDGQVPADVVSSVDLGMGAGF